MAILERAELDQAARLAGLALPDAARAADLLVRAGVLDEAPLGFAHPLLRGAVYRDIAAVDRSEAHGRAARLLAEAHARPAGVAEHLLATAPASDLWAVEQLHTAAREATARGAPESAAAYLRRAIAEPPSADRVSDLLLELGLAEFSAGQPGWQRPPRRGHRGSRRRRLPNGGCAAGREWPGLLPANGRGRGGMPSRRRPP